MGVPFSEEIPEKLLAYKPSLCYNKLTSGRKPQHF